MHPYLSNGILVMLWMYFKHHAAVATKRLLSSGKACNLGINGGSCGYFNLFFCWFCCLFICIFYCYGESNVNLKYKCKSLLIQSNLGASTDKFTLYTSSTFTKLIKKRNVSVSTYLYDYTETCPTPYDLVEEFLILQVWKEQPLQACLPFTPYCYLNS